MGHSHIDFKLKQGKFKIKLSGPTMSQESGSSDEAALAVQAG